MARAREPIDIDTIPGLRPLVEEVLATGEPLLLRFNGEDLAILRPIKRDAKRRAVKRQMD